MSKDSAIEPDDFPAKTVAFWRTSHSAPLRIPRRGAYSACWTRKKPGRHGSRAPPDAARLMHAAQPMEEASVLTESERPFVLVVGVDLEDTESSGYAINQAARLAMRIPKSETHLVYVIPTDGAPKNVHETASQMKRYIAGKSSELGGLARESLGMHLRGGD